MCMDSLKENAKIDETSFQMGCKIGPKSRKSGPGGIPKGRQEAKMIKRWVVSNSAALLGAIFEENRLQDGCPKRKKMNNNVIQNLIIFYNILTPFRKDF